MTPEELREWLNRPSRWPHRPNLPMKLFLDQGGVVTGLILEGRGLTIFDHQRQPMEQYATVEDLAEAGWEVD